MTNPARAPMRWAVAPFWRYHRRVPSIQIKNVPEDVHRTLQRQARASGQSLQEFLLTELRGVAAREVQAEIFERARQRKVSLTPGEIVRMVREDRDRH